MNLKATLWFRCGHLHHSDEETETQRGKSLAQVPSLLDWALYTGHVSVKLILIKKTNTLPSCLFFVPGYEEHNFSCNRYTPSAGFKSPAPYRFNKNHISPLLMHPSKRRWEPMASKVVAAQGAVWHCQRQPGTCRLQHTPAGTIRVFKPRMQF